MDKCKRCLKYAATLHYESGDWVCRTCWSNPEARCRLFEYGHENPEDPQGSTAHVRDIKDRRYHPQEKRMFYYSKELGKTYFFPK